MVIEQIELKQFRNYDNEKIKFNKNVNIIIGNNAQGKTNILEAIYLLSITKSYRTNDDYFLIQEGKDSSIIKGKIKDNRIPKKLEIILNKNKKTLYYNSNIIKKVSNYIGILNVIMMAPEDIEIIKGSPSERRNLINIELSKISKEYLNILNEYNKLLKMRNDYLKLIMLNNLADYRYLDIITEKLIDRAVYIYFKRNKFLNEINNYIGDIFNDISGIGTVNIKYNPNLEINNMIDKDKIKSVLTKHFKKHQNKEINLGMTLYGPHRDDFDFYISENNIKYYGSQGQQKLLVISLKIALLKIFEEKIGSKPVLLLDDVFSELDKKRKNKLIKYINEAGQVIMTTNDIRDIDKKKLNKIKVFEIKNKKIIEKGDKNDK